MRALVNINAILEEANRTETCPRCSPDSHLPIVQCNMSVDQKGRVKIHKRGYCEIHGYVAISRQVRSVRMHGADAQVIPTFE